MENVPTRSTAALLSARKCAGALFVLSALVILATLALNRSIAENRTQYDLRTAWERETSSMLGRYRAYKTGGDVLYAALTLAAITRHRSWEPDTFPSLARLGQVTVRRHADSGRVFFYGPAQPNSNADTDLLSELVRDSEVFGAEAEKSFRTASDHDDALKGQLLKASSVIRNVDARQFVTEVVIDRLISVAHHQEPWSSIKGWVVFDEWPPLVGGVFFTETGYSYRDRYLRHHNESERHFIYQTLARKIHHGV